MDSLSRQEFLDELCPQLRPLVERLMDCDCGCEVIDFFRYRTLTWIEASEIAGQLQLPTERAGQSLAQLAAIGIVDRFEVLDRAFFGLTRDPQALRTLEQFWLLRDGWRSQLEQARSALHLGG